MELRNQNRRRGLIATLPLSLLVAACGATGASTSSPSTPTGTPTPSSPLTAPTTPAPTTIPTASPTPVPTPLPVPPLAVLSYGQELKVVNSQGVEQWGLSNAAMERIFGVTAQEALTQGFGVASLEAGPNLLLLYSPYLSSNTKVAVLSRAGKVIESGTAPASHLVVSPSGTEVAWSVDATPNAVGEHHGQIKVSGLLGAAVRTVYNWVAPVGFTEQLDAWTNTGIIMQRVEYGGCGILYDPASAWFAINPSTGTLTNLFSGNEQFLGASSGVTVAALINDSHAVLINGVAYSESKSSIEGASISPDGADVAVSRINQYGGCGGALKYTVEMVTVANQSHIDLPNLSALGWWNDNEFVALTPSGSIWLYTLQGHAASELTSTWGFEGVLTG